MPAAGSVTRAESAPQGSSVLAVLVRVLEPWWVVQAWIPSGLRRILSWGAPLAIGYVFGTLANGWEWRATLLSMTISTMVTFLRLFTPPAVLRRS